MRFEIEVEIPDGYEPTGEYRIPRKGELILTKDGAEDVPGDMYGRSEPWLILREKPLRYEDFLESPFVSIDEDGDVRVKHTFWNADDARLLAAALIAAADHVDRVNAQKAGA